MVLVFCFWERAKERTLHVTNRRSHPSGLHTLHVQEDRQGVFANKDQLRYGFFWTTQTIPAIFLEATVVWKSLTSQGCLLVVGFFKYIYIYIRNIVFRCFEVFICYSHSVFFQGHLSSQTALTLAPERSSLDMIKSPLVTSPTSVVLCVWIWKMCFLVFPSGNGNLIFPRPRCLFVVLLLWERITEILNKTTLKDRFWTIMCFQVENCFIFFNFLLQNLVII